MQLTAAMIIRNELGRYLRPCVAHLLEFCDEVCVLDNGSEDGWQDEIRDDRIVVCPDPDADGQTGSYFVNHARSRQRLLDFTVARGATHVLAIDADEFVADGAALRAACDRETAAALYLCLQEVWNIDAGGLDLREDGGWVEHDVAMVWCPAGIRTPHVIVDRGPATGRTPETVSGVRAAHSCTALLHLGWANRGERADRYERYVVADGGRFHARAHLDSIMWPDDRVDLERREWPESLLPWRDLIVEHAQAVAS